MEIQLLTKEAAKVGESVIALPFFTQENIEL